MNRVSRTSGIILPCSLLVCLLLGGCGTLSELAKAGKTGLSEWTKTDSHRLFSPDKMIEPPNRSPINPILDSVSLADQTQELVPNATFPAPEDLEYVEKDYVIGPTDVLNVAILDLFQEGLETVLQREVSDTGFIDLPLLPERIKAEGLTKDELTEAIKQAYSPNIIRDPTVSVTLVARRQSTYYILGAVSRPSQYAITRRDMRLLDAMAIAGGVVQNNIPYVYVIRPAPAIRKAQAKTIVTEAPGELPALPELPELLPELPGPPPGPGAGEAPPAEAPLPEAPATEPAPVVPEIIQPRLRPEAPVTEPVRRAQDALQTNDIEAALRELGQAMPPGQPATQPEDVPSPTVMPRFVELAEVAGGGTAVAADGEAKWVYRDGKWVRVPKSPPPPPPPPVQPAPTVEPPTPPAVAAPPPAEPEVTVEPTPPVVETTRPTKPIVAPELPGIRPEVVEPPKPRGLPAEAPTPEATPETAPEQTPQVTPPARPRTGEEDPFGWRKASKSDMARIIAINLPRLQNGDPTQNIVIRDNDVINVPFLPVGEFYVTGEVLRPGVYSLPSTPVTIKQALAAAGNVGPLAWPENSILIRRIGNHQEQIIPVDVEAIFKGQEPDVYLKPNDIVAVGTDVRAPFYAVLRNAFRMTYGFGFIYDRNFSDPLFVTPRSNRFTRL